MKTMTVEEKITEIVNLAQPDSREQLETALRACAFTSSDDPALHAIHVQAILAAQPIRMVTDDNVGVATAADMARLGDRVQDVLWSILRLRWYTIIGAILLVFVAGVGATLVAFKLWPERLAPVFDLPKTTVFVADSRLTAVDDLRANFVAQKHPDGKTYIYFNGRIQPKPGKNNDGRNFLYFEP